MGGMRKLRRRSRGKQYEVEPLWPQQSFHAGKMSEVILDFAEPLLNAIDYNDELFEEVIRFAVICWNASFLPEKEQKQIFCSMVDGMAKSDVLLRLSVQNDIRLLLERKKAFFADDKRMLIEFEVIKEKGSCRLLAMSVLTKD
ncbi:MAG TPA: hypothetical protein VMW72_20250 [Sedimentisphaerales bacterium]|nr:hypothetical protein [Sedimentisphaerales bacterium]